MRPPPMITALEKEHKFKMGKYSNQKILSMHIVTVNNVRIRTFTSQSPNNNIFHTAYIIEDNDKWIKENDYNIGDGYISYTKKKWYYFHDPSKYAFILVQIEPHYSLKKIYDTIIEN